MTEEHTKHLYAKYPELFRQHTLGSNESCMCWGFDCGDGWFNIIDMMCAAITNHYKYNAKDKKGNLIPCNVEFSQIKEKMGSARFYYDGGDSFTEGVVWLAEAMSERTCETCGASAKIRAKKGWLACVCASCDNLPTPSA